MDGRGSAAVPLDGQLLCWTKRSGRRAFTACSRRTCTRIRSPLRAPTRSSLRRSPGVPVVSAKQMLDWVDGRNTSSLQRSFSWNGSAFGFTSPGIGRDRSAGDAAAAERRARTLLAHHENGSPVSFTDRDDQGHRLRALPRCRGHLCRDVRLSRRALSGRRASHSTGASDASGSVEFESRSGRARGPTASPDSA